MTNDPTDLDLAALGEAIRLRRLSPVEVTQAFLDRIAALNGRLRAYVSVYPEQALAAARAAEDEIGRGGWRGPLHGVPVAVKDLFAVAGMRRTCGSDAYDSEVCTEDAVSVARLKRAGAIVLGMLNLHEFAFGATGINRTTGTARNPWNPARSCGGSSSGSGCAVAAGLAAATLGTDTGGSIRIPAAVCGVVGLKPSRGIASRRGIFPLCRGFDQGGPLARTARGAALVLEAMAGADPHDPSTLGATGFTADGLDGGIAGLRVAVPEGYFFDDLHPDVAAAVEAALDVLRDLGATVERVALPIDVSAARRAWTVICTSEAVRLHAGRLRDRGNVIAADVRERMLAGERYSAADLVEARWTRDDTAAAMAGFMADYDVVAFPAAPIPATDAESGLLEHDGTTYDGICALGRFTRLASITGMPALSVPCGFTSDGMPAGLQLLAARFDDATLLRAASAYEQATPWHTRRPPEPA